MIPWEQREGRAARPNPDATALAADREQALALTPVSRETLARLDRFVDVLLQWQRTTNLIAPSTAATVWTRHVADSLQLLPLAPDARVWIDLGSGAGFPGLVIACALAEYPDTVVHLVESIEKKAAFLRQAVAATGAPALVHRVRIEEFVTGSAALHAQIVMARALVPMPKLLEYAAPLLKTGAQALFHKGQDGEAELTRAAKDWNIDATLVPSKTSPQARIVVVRKAERRAR